MPWAASTKRLARVQQGLHVDPLSLTAVTEIAWELYFAGAHDEAITQARKVAEMARAIFLRTCAWAWLVDKGTILPQLLQNLRRLQNFAM